ncbi:hypothetical protein [Listeria booriae]|uniref:Uncharacterized protein n=1 Tax=Listeria booriae TaxID=1552123 RepID=A0A841Y0N9_9LIST|nr:hypothetical protein [Listeria booriae]MBC1318523.1 hypothetical protein [Listeria booriae]MBC2388832.1 hypothetical protein [Listeria booriae]
MQEELTAEQGRRLLEFDRLINPSVEPEFQQPHITPIISTDESDSSSDTEEQLQEKYEWLLKTTYKDPFIQTFKEIITHRQLQVFHEKLTYTELFYLENLYQFPRKKLREVAALRHLSIYLLKKELKEMHTKALHLLREN